MKVSGVLTLVSFLASVLLFQNCGGGFQSAELNPVGSQIASRAEFAKPTLEWKTSVPKTVNAQFGDIELQYSIDANLKLKSIVCKVGTSADVDCSAARLSLAAFDEGDQVIKAILTDSAGQVAEVSTIVRIDRTPPTLAIFEAPPALSGSNSAQVVFGGSDALTPYTELAYQCLQNAGAWSTCSSPFSLSNLTDGNYSVQIKAIDAAKNESAIQTISWQIDTSAPVILISAKPVEFTNSRNATFSFSGRQGTTALSEFECQINGASFTACSNPHAIQNLTDGLHSFSVRVKSIAGTYSTPMQVKWTVDTVPPTTPLITTQASSFSSSNAASFSLSSMSSGAPLLGFECSLDNSAFTSCMNDKAYSALSEGSHSFRATALDRAGNKSAIASFNWLIDRQAPVIQWTQTPSSTSLSADATFAFTVNDTGSGLSRTQCAIDSAALSDCSSPVSYSGLLVGSHDFKVVATDKAGNSRQLSFSWMIQSGSALDGKLLYANNCASCHGPLATSAKKDRSALQIKTAIQMIPAMASIRLSDAELSAIAMALMNSSSGPLTPMAAAEKYFPSPSTDNIQRRLFRLTQEQLDATIASLLGSGQVASVKATMPPDPLVTNYPFSEVLTISPANFTAMKNWVEAAAARVRANPKLVVDCTSAGNTPACLTSQSRAFLLKAFRGDISEAKLSEFSNFFVDSVPKLGVAEAAGDLVDLALSSPRFLFREEFDLDMASQLVPAEQLQMLTYTLADAPPEKLAMPSTNASSYVQGNAKANTVNSILAGADARAKLSRFVLAWLEVKDPNEFTVSRALYPEFSSKLASSAVNETKKFLDHHLAKPAPRLTDLTRATQSFIDSNLSAFYGVPTSDPNGNTLVNVNTSQRLGILSHASVIASHSGPDTTRLVKRGAFMSRKVLCVPIAGTPPGIDTTLPPGNNLTERQKIETATNSATCLGCHTTLNPLGSFQENYSASGKWRTLDNGIPINSNVSFNFLDQGPVSTSGPVETISEITQSMGFRHCFIRQMFRFYVGRNETPSDDPLLREMFLAFTEGGREDILAALKVLGNSKRLVER